MTAIDLARWEGWRTEPRDRHGRWTRTALSVRDITAADRARGNASLDGFRPVHLASDADAAQYLRRTAPRLPAAQRDAVTRYTGDAFLAVNRALRAGGAASPEVRRLDAAARPAPDDMIVTRHVDDLGDPGELAGKVIADKAFASTALGSAFAGGLGGVTLHIAVPKGTPVINAAGVSDNAHEREVILPRGTPLAVSRAVPNASYGHDAYAVVLPPEPGSLDFAQAAPPPPPPQQQPVQPPPPQADGLDDAALAIAVAALLASAAATAVPIAVAIASLKVRFALSAAAFSALSAVMTQIMERPPAVTGIIGSASAQTSRMNAARRAQYVIAASKRVLGAAREARAKGEPVGAAVRAQLARERRFYGQHQAAMWNRARAAGQTDMAAAEHGDLLGWNTVIDNKTSLECKVADGKNYRASRMPMIGFPGAVHPFVDAFRVHRIRMRQCSQYRYNKGMQQVKHCMKCDQDKHISEFSKNTSSTGKTFYSSPCKACTNERERRRYLENKERYIARTQKWHNENKERVRELVKAWQERNPEWHQQNMLRAKARRYGLDEDLVIAYVGAHDGRCDICGRTAEEAGEQHRGGGRLCIDHDHATSEFRGLICHPCNLMLKDSQDDPGILRTAAAYLDDHPVRQFVMPAVARLDPRAVRRYAEAMNRDAEPRPPLVADPRFCPCGEDISYRHSNARYCEQCRPTRTPQPARAA